MGKTHKEKQYGQKPPKKKRGYYDSDNDDFDAIYGEDPPSLASPALRNIDSRQLGKLVNLGYL